MSLSLLMTAVAEFVGDRLVNDCGRPVPDRVLRNHGPLPDDCCTDNGALSVSFADGRASAVFPGSAVNVADPPCVLWPVYTLAIRYSVCAPVPQASAAGVEVSPLMDARYDAYAAMLADVTDCITRELVALQCLIGNIVPNPAVVAAIADPYEAAVVENVARKGFLRFVDAAPILPFAGCAGVLWRLYAAPSAEAVS